MQHGETALHRAKRSGGGRFEFYSEALTGEAGFTREQVGKITVTDQSTYVAVARKIARDAVRKLSAGKVKGKTVKVRALED